MVVRFDVNDKAYAGIEAVVSVGGIVIDIEFAVVSVLNGVCHDFRCRMIMGNHPSCSVNDGSTE